MSTNRVHRLSGKRHLEESAPLCEKCHTADFPLAPWWSFFIGLQDAVGPITSVQRAEGRCEHWVRPEYQTCVQNVGASQTLFLVGGEYFKQGAWDKTFMAVTGQKVLRMPRLLG